MSKRISLKAILLLMVAFLVYSTTGVFSKLTSKQEFLSFAYLSLFSLVTLAMGIYAILWQIILKRVALAQAFLFKSTTVIFSLLFARIFFTEQISYQNIIGAIFIVAGIIVNSLQKDA